jgi:N-acetylated-alpha-linked acidic dipeptidase
MARTPAYTLQIICSDARYVSYAFFCRAQYVMRRFEEYGIKAHLASYEVLLSYPLKRELNLVGPTQFTALLRESVPGEDPTSRSSAEVDTFLAYAPSGEMVLRIIDQNFQGG